MQIFMGGKSLLCAGVFQGELERGCFDFRRTPLELPLLAPSDWGVQGVIDLLKGIDVALRKNVYRVTIA